MRSGQNPGGGRVRFCRAITPRRPAAQGLTWRGRRGILRAVGRLTDSLLDYMPEGWGVRTFQRRTCPAKPKLLVRLDLGDVDGWQHAVKQIATRGPVVQDRPQDRSRRSGPFSLIFAPCVSILTVTANLGRPVAGTR